MVKKVVTILFALAIGFCLTCSTGCKKKKGTSHTHVEVHEEVVAEEIVVE